jgi:hypothetical protein
METLNEFTNGLLGMLDVPLGWLLALPRGVAILIVAVGTCLILTLCRKWATNQERLGCAKQDLVRLKQLKQAAKREVSARHQALKDHEPRPDHDEDQDQAEQQRLQAELQAASDRAKQIKTTISMINTRKVRAEGMPLLVSIVPIALLAIWAFSRLNYYAPQPNEPVVVEANFQPASLARGRLARLVAPQGMNVEAAIQVVEDDPNGDNGIVKWTVVPTEPGKKVKLTARYGDDAATVVINVGGEIYEPPTAVYAGKAEGITATHVHLRQATFFGLPGLHPVLMPAWLTYYLAITIVLVFPLRWVMRVN